MSDSRMQTNFHVKVTLPGERCWAIFIKSTDDGFIGKIDNDLVATDAMQQFKFAAIWPGGELPQLHNFKCGDEVEFVHGRGNYNGEWVVKGLNYQEIVARGGCK